MKLFLGFFSYYEGEVVRALEEVTLDKVKTIFDEEGATPDGTRMFSYMFADGTELDCRLDAGGSYDDFVRCLAEHGIAGMCSPRDEGLITCFAVSSNTELLEETLPGMENFYGDWADWIIE